MSVEFSRFWAPLAQEPITVIHNLFLITSGLYVTYLAGLIVYRLTLHPLSRFPGPFLCRIGYLQQGYYEAILQGKFIHEIPKYHKKYGMFVFPGSRVSANTTTIRTKTQTLGPVVRLNPNEVHVNDISVYHE